MSDWNAQHSTVASALGGLDMAMPGDGARNVYNSYWGGALTEAVLNGSVPEWRVDDMVVRIMAAFYKVNGNRTREEVNFSAWVRPNTTVGPLYFKAKSHVMEVNKHVNVQHNHAELIREMAAKSTVLLKNTNKALPLAKPKSIAVIGEDAQDAPGGPNACDDNRCYSGTLTMGFGSATANYPWVIAPYTALRARAEADGTRVTNIPTNWDIPAAVKAASEADTALVFVSATSGENFVSPYPEPSFLCGKIFMNTKSPKLVVDN
jgi:beta-glucosidase